MADQSYNRYYRENEPDRRRNTQAPSAAPGNDPLAELARLIGQNDPFAEFPPAGSRQHDDPPAAPSAADWRSGHAAQDEISRRPSAPSSYYDEPYDEDARGQSARGDTYDSDPGYSEPDDVESEPQQDDYSDYHRSGHEEPSGYEQSGYEQSSYARDARDARDARESRDARDSRGFRASPAYAERQSPPRREARAEQGPYSRNDSYARPYAQDESYAEEDSYSEQDAHESIQPEDPYDDPAPVQRRGGLVTVVAVLGLAIVGTAGAFTYRATFGKPTPPPVIKSNPTPTKVTVNQSNDAQPSKPIQERVERMVPHEEAPVDLRAVTQEAPAPTPAPMGPVPNVRQATPNPPPPSLAWAPSPAPPAAAVAPAPPKRIHTVPITKPPDADAGPGPVNILSAAAGRGTPSKPSAVASSAPLSLTPGAPTRAATPVIAPTRLPSGSSSAESGYLVQVSSQRSESDAQASFRSLKSKYAEVIGDHESTIRRADLGDKGVYYRVMVGGFGTAQEAGQFCDSLKAAGGACLVQKN